jgi:hypothetical protein
MRNITFATAVVGVLMVGPSHGACTKPDAPSCAITGAFVSAAEWDRCRIQMLSYKGGMEIFAGCLREEGRDEQLALQELEYTLSEFNRRSRELPPDGL